MNHGLKRRRKNILHRNEREIIRVLFKECQPLSINEIAEISGMSWVTSKKYINFLLDKKIVDIKKGSNQKSFILNQELIKLIYSRGCS